MLENQIQLPPDQEELVETFAPISPEEVYSPHTTILEEEKKSFPSIIIRGDGERVGGGVTEEYKRSNHEDFCTSKELKDRDFYGIRHNSISNNREIWVAGELRASLNEDIIQMNPHKWEELYSETFGLKEVVEIKREGN